MGRRSKDVLWKWKMLALSIFISGAMVVAETEDILDLMQIRTSIPCRYSYLCVQYTFCHSSGYCHCNKDFILEKNHTHFKCLRVARVLGDLCERSTQCQVTLGADAECRDSTCQCSLNSRFVEERCYKTSGLGEQCQTKRNCYVKGSDSFCVGGRCVCPLLHHPTRDGTRCVKTISLTHNCTNDEECIAKNSKCIGKCTCDINHAISSNNLVCLKTANAIGESCEEDLQCQDLNFSKCQEGKCSCPRGFHRRSSSCYLNIGLNQPCENHLQCTTLTNLNSNTSAVTNVDCINGFCSCSANHILTSDGFDCIGYAENGVSSWRLSPIILIVTTFIFAN